MDPCSYLHYILSVNCILILFWQTYSFDIFCYGDAKPLNVVHEQEILITNRTHNQLLREFPKAFITQAKRTHNYLTTVAYLSSNKKPIKVSTLMPCPNK